MPKERGIVVILTTPSSREGEKKRMSDRLLPFAPERIEMERGRPQVSPYMNGSPPDKNCVPKKGVAEKRGTGGEKVTRGLPDGRLRLDI